MLAAMVRKRVLSPLLLVAGLLVGLGFLVFVVPFVLMVPCPEEPEDLHGSSPVPSPGLAAGCGEDDDMICVRAPFAVVLAVSFVVGYTVGFSRNLLTQRFADDAEDEEEDVASGAAKKAGYVAIAAADGLEAGTCAGGKN